MDIKLLSNDLVAQFILFSRFLRLPSVIRCTKVVYCWEHIFFPGTHDVLNVFWRKTGKKGIIKRCSKLKNLAFRNLIGVDVG